MGRRLFPVSKIGASVYFFIAKKKIYPYTRRVEREFENKKRRGGKRRKITACCVARQDRIYDPITLPKNQFHGKYVSIHSTICLDLANSNYGAHTCTRTLARVHKAG